MTVSSEKILQNVENISEKYQQLLLHLMQGKGNFLPKNLIDNDKFYRSLKDAMSQYSANPEKFLELNLEYIDNFKKLVSSSVEKFIGNKAAPLYMPEAKDRRFKDAAWQDNVYFDFIKQFYIMSSNWMEKTISRYNFEPELKNYVEFSTKQFIDALAPSNFVFCNPVVLKESLDSGWQNIAKGLDNFLYDIQKSEEIFNIPVTDKSAFKIGENIAATPGKIVMQNDLIQLICYEPKKKTYKKPLLIVPPCINKYYILDLSPGNSIIKWLVEQDHQVFVISWVNPNVDLAHKDFNDYVIEGVVEPIKFIYSMVGSVPINTAGYCIGGTMLAIAGAYLKENNLNYNNSASFFATLLDYSSPGGVGVFINEASISAIEFEMNQKGYFDGRYLANIFSMLRSNDLIWSYFVNNYLLGKSPLPFDILYWNADSTNLPAKMHSFYLRNFYQQNLLKNSGGIKINNCPIDLSKINFDSFFLGAQDDHITPWKSVYDGFRLINSQKSFCLTSSGHVAGVVNPPSNLKSSYKTNTKSFLSSDEWLASAEDNQGSWWNYWKKWLAERSELIEESIDYENLKFIEYAPGSFVKDHGVTEQKLSVLAMAST